MARAKPMSHITAYIHRPINRCLYCTKPGPTNVTHLSISRNLSNSNTELRTISPRIHLFYQKKYYCPHINTLLKTSRIDEFIGQLYPINLFPLAEFVTCGISERKFQKDWTFIKDFKSTNRFKSKTWIITAINQMCTTWDLLNMLIQSTGSKITLPAANVTM